MKLFVLLLLLPLLVLAQGAVLTPTSSMTFASPGQPFVVNLGLSGVPTTGPGIAFVSWTASTPATWTLTSTTTPISSMQVDCAVTATLPATPNPGRCVLWSFAVTALANGTIAQITFTPPASATTGSVVIALSNTGGGDINGAAITVITGNALTVPVVSFDLTGDHTVSKADVREAVAQVIGSKVCSNADLTGDSNCRPEDLVREVQGWIVNGSIETP